MTTIPPVTTFNTTQGKPLGIKIGLDYVLSVEEAMLLINELQKNIAIVSANQPKVN